MLYLQVTIMTSTGQDIIFTANRAGAPFSPKVAGGAVYALNSVLSLGRGSNQVKAVFFANDARDTYDSEGLGGAIAIDGVASVAEISGATFSFNVGRRGGALALAGGITVIYQATFSGNQALNIGELCLWTSSIAGCQPLLSVSLGLNDMLWD